MLLTTLRTQQPTRSYSSPAKMLFSSGMILCRPFVNYLIILRARCGEGESPHFCFWGGDFRTNGFDVFGLFIKLRACSVDVAASGCTFAVGSSIVLAQKVAGEVQGVQNISKIRYNYN